MQISSRVCKSRLPSFQIEHSQSIFIERREIPAEYKPGSYQIDERSRVGGVVRMLSLVSNVTLTLGIMIEYLKLDRLGLTLVSPKIMFGGTRIPSLRKSKEPKK